MKKGTLTGVVLEWLHVQHFHRPSVLGQEKDDLFAGSKGPTGDKDDLLSYGTHRFVPPVVGVAGPVCGGLFGKPSRDPMGGSNVEGIVETAHERLMKEGECRALRGITEEK